MIKKFTERIPPEVLSGMKALAQGGGRAGVACSGGGDSVFLLLLALEIFPPAGLCVFHYNHAVRENAKLDEAFVRDLCRRLSVECVSETRAGALKKISEESLREARLEFFGRACASKGVGVLLQGHIKDDIAESVLMRLMRGSSADGLCAPRPVSLNLGLTLMRPLLGISKAEIQTALKKIGQPWREDESNAGNGFLRNAFRNSVIPRMESLGGRSFKDGAARSRMLLEEDARLVGEVLAAHCRRVSKTRFALDAFASASPALIRRCAQALLAENSLSLRPAGLDAFVAAAASGQSPEIALKGGASLSYSQTGRAISISKPLKPAEFCVDLKPGRNELPCGGAIVLEEVEADGALFDLFKSKKVDESTTAYLGVGPGGLIARTMRPGDKYAPHGASSPRPVSSMLSAKKTSAAKRNRLPLVCMKGGEPLWAPTLAPSGSRKVCGGGVAIRLTYLEET